MTFHDWRADIVSRGMLYGAAASIDLSRVDDRQVDQWLAGAASVIARNGEDWCRSNPQAFSTAIIGQLSTWVRIGFFIARIAGFTNPFIAIAAWLIPVLIEWFQGRYSAVQSCGHCEPIVWSNIASEGLDTAFRNKAS